MAKIKIEKKDKYEPGTFFTISNESYIRAAQELNKNDLLLWLYLSGFKGGIEWDLSPTAISNQLGISIDVAKAMTKSNGAYANLEKAGFIKDGVFYAEPLEKVSKWHFNDAWECKNDTMMKNYGVKITL